MLKPLDQRNQTPETLTGDAETKGMVGKPQTLKRRCCPKSAQKLLLTNLKPKGDAETPTKGMVGKPQTLKGDAARPKACKEAAIDKLQSKRSK